MRRLFIPIAFATILFAACSKDNTNQAPTPPAAKINTPTSVSSSSGTVSSSTSTPPSANVTQGGSSAGGNTGEGTQPKPSGTTPSAGGALVIFRDELSSGGGAFLFPGGENQTLSFNDTSNPISKNSIRYVWNGGDVAGQHIFAGVDLMHTPTLATYTSTPGKDLRAGRFTRVTFDARGSLGAGVVAKVEVADDGNTGTPAPCLILSANGHDDDSHGPVPASCLNTASLTGNWQKYSISVTDQDLQSVKDFFKSTFIFKAPSDSAPPSSGGTIFFDDIEYQP